MADTLNGLQAVSDGDLQKALKLFDRALAAIDVNSSDVMDLKLLVMLKEVKGLAYKELGDTEASARQIEEAIEMNSGLIIQDKGLDNATTINTALTLSSLGNVERAIEFADKVSIASMPKNIVNATLLIALSTVYSKSLETRGAQAKKALLKAKAIFEEEKEDNADSLLIVYKGLAEVAMTLEGDKEKMLGYCAKGWALAKKVGLGNVNLEHLYTLVKYATENTSEEESVLWHSCALVTAGKMLDTNCLAPTAARLYIFSSIAAFPYFIVQGESFNAAHAEQCYELMSEDPEIEPLPMAMAQWLYCYKLSLDKDWPSDREATRKAIPLLKKAAKTIEKLDIINSPIYACVQWLLADAHLAHGDYALSAGEYKMAYSIMARTYGDDHFYTKHCLSGLEAALDGMD
jgi:tetratricopeptide (TPR) repeat protein